MLRRLTLLAAAATLALPAGASASAASFCDPLAASPLTLAPLAGAAGRGAREPGLDQPHSELPTAAKGQAKSGFTAQVPVYFHVVTDGRTGAVSDRQIARQIAVLNQTFAGQEGGAATGFSFVLAGVTRTDDADWFWASSGGVHANEMKLALRRGGRDALNLYSTSAGDYLGWAYFPDILDKPGQEHLDGVVINWETIPGVSDTWAGKYDRGETATHEVGHWLMLEHTFYGGCSAKGDHVSDTPPEKTATSGCPVGKDTCSAPGDDPIHNYMDYSYDSCYTEFTKGQAQRMRDAWLYYRAPR